MNVFDEIGLNPDSLDRNIFGRVAKTLIRARLPDAKTEFEAASIAAEGWFDIVAAVVRFGQGSEPNVDGAYELLMPTKGKVGYSLFGSYFEHEAILLRMNGKLTALRVGRVKLKPLNPGEYPIVWSNAHEAAAGITRMVLEMLVCPIAEMTDPDEQFQAGERLLVRHWEKFDMSPQWIASLQERIRRERTMLLEKPAQTKLLEKLAPAGDLGDYVPVGSVWHERSEFKRASDVTRYLDKLPNEPAPAGIRNRRKGQRRFVHAADWLKHFDAKDRKAGELLDDEVLHEKLADIETRKEQERKRKRGK